MVPEVTWSWCVFLLIFLLNGSNNIPETAAEPVTIVFGATALTLAGIGVLSKPLYCKFMECCTQPNWIRTDVPGETECLLLLAVRLLSVSVV